MTGILNGALRVATMVLVATLVACGCTSIDLATVPRVPSAALAPEPGTRLHDSVAPRVAAQQGRSGFAVLERGLDAFVARAALAELAERTLDLQYYIVHGDTSGLLLLGRVLAAADRGVRVRLLIDDWTLHGSDEALARLDAHPSIEVRLFNPAANRSWWSPARWLETIGDVRRINRRMHNKAWIADNTFAIVGGRNLGDEYFEAREDLDYHDLDLLAAGPVVRETSASFDTYWNSDFAVPLATFARETGGKDVLDEVRRRFREHEAAVSESSYARALRGAPLVATLRAGTVPLHWGEARLLADDPEKLKRPVDDPSLQGESRKLLLSGQLSELAPPPQRELLAVAPYFVPGDAGVASFGALVGRGVSVRVLTNSLMSNDVLATQAGYAKYREALLRAGVSLYELKPSGPGRGGGVKLRDSIIGSSRAALHEKSFVIDRSTVFVGSLNLDPRSVRLNSEVGVLVRSAPLAAEIAAIFERNAAPASAWRVELRDSRVAWIDGSGDGARVVEDDPGSSAWRRFMQRVYGVLAPESLL
jgi:putative cardiolipin synthase